MSARQPPHDDTAERALLGAMLLTPQAVDEVKAVLLPQDFYRPTHQHIFAACLALHNGGDPVDVTNVAGQLARDGVATARGELLELQVSTPSARNAGSYARTVADHSIARRALGVFSAGMERVFNRDDAGSIADDAITDLRLLSDEATVESEVVRMADYAAADKQMEPWVIPGLLRRMWSCVVIAEEGAGKTVLLRQVAIAAAAGVHPLTHKRMDGIKTLIVDLENPPDHVLEVSQPLLALAAKHNPTWDKNRCQFMHVQGGLNLRKRPGRARLLAAVQETRPDLMVIGPVKNMSRRAGDDWDTDAEEVQGFVDDLRVRFSMAVMLEHHQPQAREHLQPKGSSLWRSWPELGLGLVRKKDDVNAFGVIRFRGDRVHNRWPHTIYRDPAGIGSAGYGGGWPWRASTHEPEFRDVREPPAGLPYKDGYELGEF